MKRKHISWKTKCAAAVLALNHAKNIRWGDPLYITYADAKQMTEDQFLSLYHWDHNILHETEDPNRDMFWNLTPMFIGAHREKTKKDAKIIAKSRRIRKRLDATTRYIHETLGDAAFKGIQSAVKKEIGRLGSAPRREHPFIRLLQSRGFDTTKTKGFDGKVRERRK